jgi:3-hydroxybutyrate dehydrogenase
MGIARALAAEGCAIMLNGFGILDEIERQCADVGRTYGVKVLYNGANLAQPQE